MKASTEFTLLCALSLNNHTNIQHEEEGIFNFDLLLHMYFVLGMVVYYTTCVPPCINRELGIINLGVHLARYLNYAVAPNAPPTVDANDLQRLHRILVHHHILWTLLVVCHQ